MRWFHVLDLSGRAVILLSVMFQLLVMNGFQADVLDIQVHAIQLKLDWLRHWLENNEAHPTIGWLEGHEFWTRPERAQANILSAIFVCTFLLGSVLTLTARFFEVKAEPKP